VARRTPVHKRITDELRKRIVAQYYKNDELASELQLTKEFEVSRHTVRTALQTLVNDGLIERRAGSGTRIIRASRIGFWAIGSSDDLAGGDFVIGEALTFSVAIEPIKSYPDIAKLFKLKPSARIFHIVRILTNGGVPYALSHLFTLPRLAASIPDKEISKHNLLKLVQKYAGVQASRARQMATVGLADLETSRRLGISEDQPILILHRTWFSADDQILVHSELSCRPDRYQQVINFVRA
jgi:DNA-binding GntR family transcriptional regulator